MYKLLFCIITFSVSYATLAQAPTINNTILDETISDVKSKHYTDIKTKKYAVPHEAIKNTIHNKIKTYTSQLQFYKAPENTKRDNTTGSHLPPREKKFPINKTSKLKNGRIWKVRDTIKPKKKVLRIEDH